jgi:hypothetical protein
MIANGLDRLRPGSPLVPLVVGLLLLLHCGPAAAQQPDNILPAVSYPFPVPGTTGPVVGIPTAVPGAGQYADSSAPVQYEMVGGVWGYWDRGRRFHRAPASFADGRPFNVITPSAVAGVPVAATPHAIMRRPSVPVSVVRLPNASPGRIVARSAMTRGRGPVR